jgi:hypothetical protein
MMLPAPPPPGEPIVRPSIQEYLRHHACGMDAIVIGVASPERVLLNTSESALFTKYTLSVEEWIHPARGEPSLKLAYMGGSAELRNGTFLSFEVSPDRRPIGRRLFFLSLMASTSVRAGANFEIADGQLSPFLGFGPWGVRPDELLPGRLPLDASTFLGTLRTALKGC